MKMSRVEDRRIYLASLLDPTTDQLNELRDCEITLGMSTVSPKTRSEAARRCEARDLTRETEKPIKKSHAQIKREIDAVLAGQETSPEHRLFRVDIEGPKGSRIITGAKEALDYGTRRGAYLTWSKTSEMLDRLKSGKPVTWSYGFTSVTITPL
jgi:hypothetical protein